MKQQDHLVMEYWKVVHQTIQLNPLEERDMAVLQGLRNLGIEKGKPFAPTAAQQKILEEAVLVGETWAMGNSFLKRDPVRHWGPLQWCPPQIAAW